MDQTDMSDGDPAESELHAVAGYLYEVGHLKRSARTGWWLAGISDPESVGEHIFRTAVIGYMLAEMEGADPARTALLCLFHDAHDTRIGDIPSVGREFLDVAPEITANQLAGLPASLAGAIGKLAGEYEARDSVEAQLAKDADRLECLLQAREYETQGFNTVSSWIKSSESSLTSATGKRLAAACKAVEPGEWWKQYVENHALKKPPSGR